MLGAVAEIALQVSALQTAARRLGKAGQGTEANWAEYENKVKTAMDDGRRKGIFAGVFNSESKSSNNDDHSLIVLESALHAAGMSDLTDDEEVSIAVYCSRGEY